MYPITNPRPTFATLRTAVELRRLGDLHLECAKQFKRAGVPRVKATYLLANRLYAAALELAGK